MENANARSYLIPPTILLVIFCFTLVCLVGFEIFLASQYTPFYAIWLPFTLIAIVFILVSLKKWNEEKTMRWVWIQGIFTLVHFWAAWATFFFPLLATLSARSSFDHNLASQWAMLWGIGIPVALWLVVPSLWYTIRASYLFQNFGQVPQWPSFTFSFKFQNPFASSPLRPRRILLFLGLVSCVLFFAVVIGFGFGLRVHFKVPGGFFIGFPIVFSLLSLVQVVLIFLILNGGEENEWMAWGSLVLSIAYSSMTYAFCLEVTVVLWAWRSVWEGGPLHAFFIRLILFWSLSILVGVWTVFPSAYHTYKLLTTRREEEDGFSKLENVDDYKETGELLTDKV